MSGNIDINFNDDDLPGKKKGKVENEDEITIDWGAVIDLNNPPVTKTRIDDHKTEAVEKTQLNLLPPEPKFIPPPPKPAEPKPPEKVVQAPPVEEDTRDVPMVEEGDGWDGAHFENRLRIRKRIKN